jgi:hypothetical protein
MRLLIIYSLFISVCLADTNDINYKDLTAKENTHEQLENLYFLKVSKDKVITGHNIIDYNGFSNIDRVKTYTTFKINF